MNNQIFLKMVNEFFFFINKSPLTLLRIFWKYEYKIILKLYKNNIFYNNSITIYDRYFQKGV